MEEFLGQKYVLVSSENFDDYLTFIGVGFFKKKVAVTLKPVQCLTLNDDGKYSFEFVTPLTRSSFTFTPGVEFDEVKPDGIKVKSLITFEGNKMIHIQREDEKVSKHVREFFPDKLVVTTTAEGFDKIVTRIYEVVK